MAVPANTKVGDRYRDRGGGTHIVVGMQGRMPMLIEDFEILDDPAGFEWDASTWEWAESHWGPLEPIDSDRRMTEAVLARSTQKDAIDEIMAAVPPAQHRDMVNGLHAVHQYTAQLTEAQAQLERIAADRARELRKLVAIFGTQAKTATVLGINQSTLSRALRPREGDKSE
jgi:hypothetical protein